MKRTIELVEIEPLAPIETWAFIVLPPCAEKNKPLWTKSVVPGVLLNGSVLSKRMEFTVASLARLKPLVTVTKFETGAVEPLVQVIGVTALRTPPTHSTGELFRNTVGTMPPLLISTPLMVTDTAWKLALFPLERVVTAFVDNAAGQLLTKWLNADGKGINKIVLSGDKSHRVAFTSMPALYIGKGKPNFDTSFNDEKVWHQGETKPDPSTNIESVQISAPVKDGDKVIGVLLVALTVSNL